MDSEGGVDASSAAGQHLTLSSGADVLIQSSGATGETLIGASAQEQEEGSSDTVSLRVRDDRIISNAPAQLADVRTPVDSRIIHEGEGESATGAVSVDEDAVLQRVMEVPVRSFSYTEEWRQIQSMGEEAVHGIIGQEVAQMMPEWVSVMEELSFSGAGLCTAAILRAEGPASAHGHARLAAGPTPTHEARTELGGFQWTARHQHCERRILRRCGWHRPGSKR